MQRAAVVIGPPKRPAGRRPLQNPAKVITHFHAAASPSQDAHAAAAAYNGAQRAGRGAQARLLARGRRTERACAWPSTRGARHNQRRRAPARPRARYRAPRRELVTQRHRARHCAALAARRVPVLAALSRRVSRHAASPRDRPGGGGAGQAARLAPGPRSEVLGELAAPTGHVHAQHGGGVPRAGAVRAPRGGATGARSVQPRCGPAPTHAPTHAPVPTRLLTCAAAATGDLGTAFYVILRGRVSVSVAGAGQVATLKTGDHFGELALLREHQLRSATVTALEPAELLCLERRDYEALLMVRRCAVLRRAVSRCVVLRCTASCCAVLGRAVSCCAVLRCAAPCCVVLRLAACCVALRRAASCCAARAQR